MRLTSSISNALSGLNAAARTAELVSSNISNALTEGYGRREIALSARAGGVSGGVQVDGVTRHIAAGVIADRRLMDASSGHTGDTLAYFQDLQRLVGDPTQPHSLTALQSAFEATLIEAGSAPHSDARLAAILDSAQNLASRLNDISDGLQSMREVADQQIKAQVDRINTAMHQVRDLNTRIGAAIIEGRDSSALEDQRQQIIDTISDIVPLRQVPRQNGAVALYTSGGEILLDGSVQELEFTPTNTIVPHMTQSGGLLSGLSINGRALDTSEQGTMRGGTLAAQFAVRDELAVDAQTQLDAMARDMIERFQGTAVDPTLGAGDAGLFTDAGLAFLAANETAISSRISVNTLVVPAQGGDLWRLRDGLAAAASGDTGDGSLLQAMSQAMSNNRTIGSGSFGASNASAADLTAYFASEISRNLHAAEGDHSFAAVQLQELTALELSEGVDTDHELQTLMLVEQNYAANARMLQTVDEMMQTILGI